VSAVAGGTWRDRGRLGVDPHVLAVTADDRGEPVEVAQSIASLDPAIGLSDRLSELAAGVASHDSLRTKDDWPANGWARHPFESKLCVTQDTLQASTCRGPPSRADSVPGADRWRTDDHTSITASHQLTDH
jgi:hypothetical protein